MKILLHFMICLSVFPHLLTAQQISKEELLFLTPEWKGERFQDGRPKVSDDILKRMKQVTLEGAWAVCRGDGRILAPNSWAIDMLQPGDVYVVDQHGAEVDGLTIGDNLGNRPVEGHVWSPAIAGEKIYRRSD